MAMNGSFVDRILRFGKQERLSIIIAVVVLALAGFVGLLMGGIPFVGAVGVLIVVVAFGLMAWRNRRGDAGSTSTGTALASFGIATVAVLLLIQVAPYGHAHANPPVTGEPAWASPETRQLMVDACFGCHSNEVDWPWYSNIAPFSWVVTHHVDEGRERVNYSEFDTGQRSADETIEVIREGGMPPAYYTVLGLHPDARLTDAEIETLVAGLSNTPGLGDDEGGGRDHEDHEEDDDD